LPMRELGLSRLGAAAARLVDARAAELGLGRRERRDLVEAVRSQLVLPGTEQLLPYLYAEPGTLADYLPARTLLWMQGARAVLVATTESQRDRAVALLAGHGLALTPTRAPFPQALSAPGRALLALVGELTRGVWLPADRLALVTEAEIFGERRQVRRGPRARPVDFLSTLAELKPDDYVVHVDHGIGVYRGLRHMRVADTEGDYLHLEYA